MTTPVLVPGRAGYIGSHTVAGLDNLGIGLPEALARVARIAGRAPTVVEAENGVGAVPRFVVLKPVGDNVRQPLPYDGQNTLALCQSTNAVGVFSSSTTVYREPTHTSTSEATPTGRPTDQPLWPFSADGRRATGHVAAAKRAGASPCCAVSCKLVNSRSLSVQTADISADR